MTIASTLRLRVSVTDVWDTVDLDVAPTDTVAHVKAEALARATGRAVDLTAYSVKFRGALILDEAQTLEALAVPDGAAMIVLPARRRPVR